MFAVVSSTRATCPNTEMRRRDKRSGNEVSPVRCSSTSSCRTRSYHRIPSSCVGHFWWKAFRVLTSADRKVQVSVAYSNTDKTSVRACRCIFALETPSLHSQSVRNLKREVTSCRKLLHTSLHIRFKDAITAQARLIRRVRSGRH